MFFTITLADNKYFRYPGVIINHYLLLKYHIDYITDRISNSRTNCEIKALF